MCLKLTIHRTFCETQRIVHLQRSPPAFNFDIYHPLEPPASCCHTPDFEDGDCTSHGPCCRHETVLLCDIFVNRHYLKCLGELEAHLIIPPNVDDRQRRLVLTRPIANSGSLDPGVEQAAHEALRKYMNHGAEVRKGLEELGLEYPRHPPGPARQALRAVNPDLVESWEMAQLDWNNISLDLFDPDDPVYDSTICYQFSACPNWYSAFKIRNRVPESSSRDSDSSSSSSDSDGGPGNDSSGVAENVPGPFTPGGSTILPSVEIYNPLPPATTNQADLLSPDCGDSREPAPEASEGPGGESGYDGDCEMSFTEDTGTGDNSNYQINREIELISDAPEQEVQPNTTPRQTEGERRAGLDAQLLNEFALSLARNIDFNRRPENAPVEPEVLESPRGTTHRRLSFVYQEQHTPEPRFQPGLRVPAIINPSAEPIPENYQPTGSRVSPPAPPSPLGSSQTRPLSQEEREGLPSIGQIFRIPLAEGVGLAPIVNMNARPVAADVQPVEPPTFAPVPPNPLQTSQDTLIGQSAPIFANQLPPDSQLLDQRDGWLLNQPHPNPPFIWSPPPESHDGSTTNPNSPRSEASTTILPNRLDPTMLPPATQAPGNQSGYPPMAPPRAAGMWSGDWPRQTSAPTREPLRELPTNNPPSRGARMWAGGWPLQPNAPPQAPAVVPDGDHASPGSPSSSYSMIIARLNDIQTSPAFGPVSSDGTETNPGSSLPSTMSPIDDDQVDGSPAQPLATWQRAPGPQAPGLVLPDSYYRNTSSSPSLSPSQREESPLPNYESDEDQPDSESEEESSEEDDASASNRSGSSHSDNNGPPPPPGPFYDHGPGPSPPSSPPQAPPGSTGSPSGSRGQDNPDSIGSNNAQNSAVNRAMNALSPPPATTARVSHPDIQNNQSLSLGPVPPSPWGQKRRSSSVSSDSDLESIMECKLRRLENELRSWGSTVVPKKRRFY